MGTSIPPLGPFRLIARIGRGASAEVWRGRHPDAQVDVAIKILTGARTEAALRSMASELRAVARMDHPGIVRVHTRGRLSPAAADALGLPAEAPYFVMDLAGRRTLRSALGQLDWPALRDLLRALLDALGHAHARGIVHRDLKPDNILWGPAGPTLTDFGIALAADDAGDSGNLGTPNYMAPEQVRGDVRAIGPWTDLYAVGCLAHALATGRAPFAGRGSMGALEGHLHHAPPALTGDWPAGFGAWLRRAMAKSPHARFRFAADAAWALAAIDGPRPHAGAPPDATPPDWRRPPPPPPARLAGVRRSLFDLREIDPVGREAEQSALWAALNTARRDRRARVVILDGPTGSGTSHLARWLTRRAHALGLADVLWAEHHPPAGGTGSLSRMLAERLGTTGLEAHHAVARVAEALDLPPDHPWALAIAAAADPARRARQSEQVVRLARQQEFEASVTLALERLCGQRGLVMVLDDAQWAPEGIAFVRRLLERGPGIPLLIVLTVLPDRLDADVRPLLAALARRGQTRTIALGPLDDAALSEAIRRLAPAGPALVQALVRRAAGEPERAIGLLRRWSADGALAQDRDGLRLMRRPPPTPADDHGLWLDRIGRILGEPDHPMWRCLELAAVLGEPVDDARWRALARRAALPDDVGIGLPLANLADEGLVLDGPRGWRPAHGRLIDALVHRAADAGRLRRWHTICADTLAADPRPAVERLGRHRAAAGDPGSAVDPFLAAAAEARRRTDGPGMRRTLMQAARALRASGVRDDPRWVEVGARWALADVSAGRLGRARARARRMDARARTPRGRAWAAYALGEATLGSDARAAEMHLDRAERHARRAALPRLALRCAESRGWSMYHRGRYARVERLTAQAVAGMPDAPPLLRANLSFLRAVAARTRGDDAALIHLAHAASLYQAAGARHGQASVRNEMGEIALSEGRLDDALGHYHTARRIFDVLGSRSVIIADLNLGRVLDALGRHREGEHHRQVALRSAEARGDTVMGAFAAVCLLVDHARRGRLDLWPARFAALTPMLSGALIAPEAADAARTAGELAEAAGAHAEAARAYDLAAVQLIGLDRDADASEMVIRADRLRGAEAP